MDTQRLFRVLLAVVICSLVLAGCDKKELEQTKFELANTKGLLARSEQDKEGLQTELDAVIIERDKLSEELNKNVQWCNSLAEEHMQLMEGKIRLEATIKELQDKLKDAKLP